MPAQTIAHALPFVNWITLVALASGSFGFAALAGQATDATRGYVGFTAFCAALLAGLALAADGGLPAPDSTMAFLPAPATFDALRRVGLAALAILALLYVIAVARRLPRARFAVAGLAAVLATLAAAAYGWAASPIDAVPLLVQLGALAAAAGGGLAALVLAHWYLVTPRLSEAPMLVLARALAIAIGIQLLLFIVWAAFGGGPGQVALEALTGSTALYGWLRLVISLLFPLILTAMAFRTAQTRSMESATGLLYIAFAAIAAGTIGAAALYVTRGILV